MAKIIVQVDGMACPKCEARVNKAVSGAFQVKSVKADHVKKITEIETDVDLDLDKVKEVITAAGYTVNGFTTEA